MLVQRLANERFDNGLPAHVEFQGGLIQFLQLTVDEQRLVITDYFLNEDSFGKVHAEEDHKVHVARVERNNLELDPRFRLNFNADFATGPARPHGVAMK